MLCFHGNLLYEAKCVKTEVKEKSIRYFIHYNGWNKNWDEWVPESRVLKFNDAGIQKQKELLKANAGQKGQKRGGRERGQVGRPKAGEKKDASTSEKQSERSSTPTTDSRPGRGGRKAKDKDKDKDTDKGVASDRESRASTPTTEATPKERTDKRKTSVTESKAEKDKGKDKKDKTEKDSKDKDKDKDKDKEAVESTPKAGDKRKSSAPTPTPVETPVAEPKKKRSRIEATVETEETFAAKIEVRIKIPDELKPWLKDDWDFITRQKMLVSLPCKMTVDSILDDYTNYKLSKEKEKENNTQKDAILELTAGVRDYFNVMLGTQLLYKFERIQYGEILSEHPDTPMCKIYGVMHLVRLFTKLGSMLAYTPLDEKSLGLLVKHLQDLLRFIVKNSALAFNPKDYYVAPPEYHRRSL